jgi:PAS domain S-box-containing protein
MMVKDYKSSEEDIEYIFIEDPQGVVVAHTFNRGFPVELKKLNTPNTEQAFTFQHFASERGTIADIAVPLLKGVAGTLHIGFSERSISKDVDEVVSVISLIIIAGLAFGTGVAIVIARAIARPVSELARAAQAVEGGDLNVQVPVQSHDEIGLLGTAFNDMIAARKRAEEGLRKSEKKLHDITSSLGEGVMVIDEQGRLEFMNPEAERLLGWNVQELIGTILHDRIHHHTVEGSPLPAAECPSLSVLKTGERVQMDEDAFLRKDGTLIPVTYISAPILEGGRVIAAVIAFHDITQRKQIEEERERLFIDHMDALSKIKTLSGMLPICSSCKRIRDDEGYWTQIETYINEHSEAEFSHGLCPECASKIYPEYYKKDEP